MPSESGDAESVGGIVLDLFNKGDPKWPSMS
jgi:hypothetical protein